MITRMSAAILKRTVDVSIEWVKLNVILYTRDEIHGLCTHMYTCSVFDYVQKVKWRRFFFKKQPLEIFCSENWKKTGSFEFHLTMNLIKV